MIVPFPIKKFAYCIFILLFCAIGNIAFAQKIGIRTNAPTNDLHVFSTSNPVRFEGLQSGVNTDSLVTSSTTGVLRWRSPRTLLNAYAWLLTGNSGTSPVSNFIGTTDLQDVAFRTNNLERLRILSGGNIGIGTTTPGSTLDIKGTLRLSGSTSGFVGFSPAAAAGSTTYTLPAADGTSGQQLSTNGAGILSWTNPSAATTNTLALSGNTLTSTVNGTSATSNTVSTVANTSTTNSLTTTVNGVAGSAVNIINSNALSLVGSNITSTVNGVSSLSLDITPAINANAWQLGGNTTTVLQNLGTNSNFDLPIETNGVEKMRILTTGNVGIGTISPVNKLDVEGSLAIGATYSGSTAAPANGAIIQGNVGIGTSAPLNRLDVSGATVIGASYSATNTAPSNGALIEGNVGIGTTTVANKLDVEGGMAVGATFSGTTAAPSNGAIFQGNVGIGTSTVPQLLTLENGNLYLNNSNNAPAELRLAEPSGAGGNHFTAFRAQAQAANVTYTLPAADGTNGQLLGTNGIGVLGWVSPTNTLVSSGNTITSTTNGVPASANLVNSVSNTSSVNSLTTTVNGVTGTPVNLVNSNTTSLSGTNLTTTVNGVASTALDLTPAFNAAAWKLGGNAVASAQNLGTTTAFDLPFITNNTEKMRVTSAGNVGIGSTAPSQKLEVFNGNILLNNNTNAAGEFRFVEPSASGANYSAFKAQAQSVDVTYTLPAGAGVTGQQLTTDGVGNLTWANANGSTTNTLALSGNTLTSTVNGVAATSNAVSSVANTSSANSLTTTVNGVAGTAVNIINSASNTSSTNSLTTTINGVATTPVNIINSNATSLIGTNLTTTVNGVASTPLDLTPLLTTTAWKLGGNAVASVQNLGTTTAFDLPLITNNTEKMRVTSAGNVGIGVVAPTEKFQVTNGNIFLDNNNNVAAELRFEEPSTSGTNYTSFKAQAQAANITYTLPAAIGTVGQQLTTDATGNLTWTNANGATTNTLALSGNTLTSTVNGVTATSNTVSSVANTSSTNTLTTTVNGVAGTAVNLINSASNTSSANSLTTTINGIATTPVNIINSNSTSLSGTNLTTTVNGVASTPLDLSPVINSTSWKLTGNTGTSATTNFLGTTDLKGIRFRTNNLQRMIIDSIGKVGIGIAIPTTDLDVVGLGRIQTASTFNMFLNGGNTTATGTYNTVAGVNSMVNVTTGSNNAAYGSGALNANTTGAYNTAVGASALYANTTGTSNVGFGNSALLNSTIGIHNTGIGTSSLLANISGVQNVGLGSYSLSGVTTGNNNIGLGYGAGDNITTGSDNIIIGYQVKAPVATGNAQLNIGNLIYGTNIGTGTTLSTGNVGIGITTPTEKLQVTNGNISLDNNNNVAAELKFDEPSTSGANYTSFKAQAQAANITYTLPAAIGTAGQQLTTDATGNLTWTNANGLTTNTLALSGNTLTSTVNGVAATSNAVSSVANTSSANSLTTTINGVAGTAVNIINSASNTSSTNSLTTTINGVATTPVNIINSNATSLSGTNLTTTVNGVASTPLDISPAIGLTAWKLTGNAGTVDATNFIGTIDNIPFNIRVNAQKSGRISTDGSINSFGYQAGASSTATFGNSYFGYRAGISSTGNNNTFIGYNTGSVNVAGVNNSFLGTSAGTANTSGLDNTFIGFKAGFANTTGQTNTMLGSQAGVNTTSANQSTYVGFESGRQNLTGSDNTFVGYQSGRETLGAANTFVGKHSGLTNTTGTNNTLIGFESNVGAAGLSNATAIGYKAVAGASNTLVLGGTGVDNVNVGIGTTTPAATLDMSTRTDGVLMPKGTTAERPAAPQSGMIRYNSTLGRMEYYNGSAWISL